MAEIDLTKLLTKKQKAIELGVSTRTIKRYANQGKLSVVKIPKSKRMWFLPKNDIIKP